MLLRRSLAAGLIALSITTPAWAGTFLPLAGMTSGTLSRPKQGQAPSVTIQYQGMRIGGRYQGEMNQSNFAAAEISGVLDPSSMQLIGQSFDGVWGRYIAGGPALLSYEDARLASKVVNDSALALLVKGGMGFFTFTSKKSSALDINGSNLIVKFALQYQWTRREIDTSFFEFALIPISFSASHDQLTYTAIELTYGFAL